MKLLSTIIIFCLFGSLLSGQNPVKLRRADSYWGLHFDHHSKLNETHLGKTLTEGMVDSMLRISRVEYLQIDCKGHPGVSSYPTLVGQQAASYDKDPMAIFRKVTENHKVGLYVHYSGVIDNNYVRLHPEEAVFNPDGKANATNTSLWGPYADKLLIPQMIELNDKYHVDGAWIDGECWALEPDYQSAAKAEFTQKTGITNIPVSPDNPDFKKYLEFNRQKFISYLDHYITVLHAHNPDFQICSNWAYSAQMPEPITTKMDFISGDLAPVNALNSAAWNSRCLANQGKPWDVMSWNYTWDWHVKNSIANPKTAMQLCQEGAEVITMGGGYGIYFNQSADLSVRVNNYEVIKEVADFILPRKEFCFKSVPVPQIALLYSTEGWKNKTNSLYRDADQENIQGVLYALLDGQNAVEVQKSYQLMKSMDKYPVVVVPEWETMEPELKVKMKEYIKNGGNVLVIGAKATRQFDDISGVKEKGNAEFSGFFLGYDHRMAQFQSNFRPVELSGKDKPFATMYSEPDTRFPAAPAAVITNYGKGKLACVYTDMGSSYKLSTSPVVRDFLSGIVRALFPSPLVTIKGSHRVHVVPAMKNGKMMINLINTLGDHSNLSYAGFDEIPSLGNLEVSVLLENKPLSMVLQPEGKKLNFTYVNGKAIIIVPEIKIHNVIEIIR